MIRGTVTGLIGAVMVGAVLATPAGAVQVPPGTPIPPTPVVEAALKKMLTYADVPAILRVAPGWEYTVKADNSLVQTLCTKDGVSIDGPPESLLFQVELGETDATEDLISTEQKVWQYDSANQAKRGWRIMVERANKCHGRTREPDGKGGWVVQYLSHGRTPQQVNGTAGIWIWSQMKGGGTGGPDGGYYVLSLAGDTIQSVEYDYRDSAGLNAAKRRAVDRMAHTLVTRWLAN